MADSQHEHVALRSHARQLATLPAHPPPPHARTRQSRHQRHFHGFARIPRRRGVAAVPKVQLVGGRAAAAPPSPLQEGQGSVALSLGGEVGHLKVKAGPEHGRGGVEYVAEGPADQGQNANPGREGEGWSVAALQQNQ